MSRHFSDETKRLLAAFPKALRLLRERAGYASLRPAAQAIEEKTGHKIGAATLSEWDRGTLPVVDSLVYFLVGLGYDFTSLQRALEEVIDEGGDPTAELVKRLRDDAEVRKRLEEMIRMTTAAPDQPGEALNEVLRMLEEMGASNGE